MKALTAHLTALLILNCVWGVSAEVKVATEQLQFGSGFAFENLTAPATNDAGTRATWKLVGGERDRNGAELDALHDGKIPAGDDEPRANFFFQAGSGGGRIHVDLGEEKSVERIGSYSRHNAGRAPQVYTVYGAGADADAADLGGADPEKGGWKRIASVDTRGQKPEPGGRHGVSITDPAGGLGKFSQLLFDIRPTDERDRFGLTFFSEIDIVTSDDPKLTFVPAGKPPKVLRFQTGDNRFSFQLDASEAPGLLQWSENELAPVVLDWYPKLVALLPSDGYEAPLAVTFQFRNDMPPGVPASASGSRVNLNAPWFENQLEGEAKGCVIHELVHVVENYWRARLVNRNAKPTPGWLTEGIADYVRWFLYEPEKRGALLSPKRLAAAKHDASYRVTANFIDWVARHHDQDIARKLNAAAREGRYQEALWEEYTGKSIAELADAWRAGE